MNVTLQAGGRSGTLVPCITFFSKRRWPSSPIKSATRRTSTYSMYRSPIGWFAVGTVVHLREVVVMAIAEGRLYAKSTVVGNYTERSVGVHRDASRQKHTQCSLESQHCDNG